MQFKKSLFVLIALIAGIQVSVNGQKLILKGKVHNWVTDTVYVSHLPFYSPHSSTVDYQVISRDSTFYFKWDNITEPTIVGITYLKSFSDQIIENLLLENLTEEFYFGQCLKFFQNGSTVYLLEPNSTLNIDLTANTWLDTLTEKQADYYRNLGVKILDGNLVRDFGKTEIKFIGNSDNFNNNYYQDFFIQRNKIDLTLDSYSSKNINMAMVNAEEIMRSLLLDLEKNKNKLSPIFYEYIKTEIEFGTKMQLLMTLSLKNESYLKEIIFNNNYPESLLKIFAFDKFRISNTAIKSEMYNEYLEFYINFVMNIVEPNYINYHPFDKNKIGVVFSELPEKSFYYYVANHLLEVDDIDAYKDFYDMILFKFPDGELNEKLKNKFE